MHTNLTLARGTRVSSNCNPRNFQNDYERLANILRDLKCLFPFFPGYSLGLALVLLGKPKLPALFFTLILYFFPYCYFFFLPNFLIVCSGTKLNNLSRNLSNFSKLLETSSSQLERNSLKNIMSTFFSTADCSSPESMHLRFGSWSAPV